MKNPELFLLLTGVALFGSMQGLGESVRIIANQNLKIDTIKAEELKRVFLEENILLEGAHVEPVLEKEGLVHEAFLHEYIGQTDDNLQSYYRLLSFTGRGSIPKAMGSDNEVVAYVARTRGAIGYVSSSTTTTKGVKTLVVEDARHSAQRKLITRVEPDYPETLKRLNIGGTVRLRVSISAKGNVEKVELLGGNPILGESAAVAVKKWVYAAASSPTMAEVSLSFDAR